MSNTLKIGFVVSAALALLAYFILKVEDLNPFSRDAARAVASFESVAGLDDKSAVRVAGVRVGRVDGIRLSDGRAQVELLLETPVELRQGASAAIVNQGMLGDKYVVLDPGPEGAPPLPAGAVLPGSTAPGLDDAMARFDGIGRAIEETLGAMDPDRSGEAIRNVLLSLEETTAAIRDLVRANEGRLDGTIQNFEEVSRVLAAELPRISRQTGAVIASVEAILEENRGTVRESLQHLAEATATLQDSLVHVESISGRLAEGEGSVGKLLTEDTAHDQLVSTLASVESGVESLSDTLNRVKRLELQLGLEAYYLEKPEESHTEFQLRLDPGGDSKRFYRVGLVDDPRGRVRSETREQTVIGPDGSREVTTVRTVKTEDKQTLSAQVGFVEGATQFRAGLFESTGGAGFDYAVLEDRLRFSLEAFDFGREDDLDPRLRVIGRFQLFPNAYLMGGFDDLLESDRSSVFLGGGIRWSDDDLKYLLGSLPIN